jgi:hypothetical protein
MHIRLSSDFGLLLSQQDSKMMNVLVEIIQLASMTVFL